MLGSQVPAKDKRGILVMDTRKTAKCVISKTSALCCIETVGRNHEVVLPRLLLLVSLQLHVLRWLPTPLPWLPSLSNVLV